MRIPYSTPMLAMLAAFGLAGCLSTPTKMGDSGAKTVATGSAGGANAVGENSALEKCKEAMGTVAVVEDNAANWYTGLAQHGLQSTVPVIRMLIQQSNCFVVVDRGRGMDAMKAERSLRESGEMRDGSSMDKGQMVAADFTMNPTVTFKQKDTGGIGAAVGGLLGKVGTLVAGGVKFNEASTMLTMIDNRSGVQLAAAEGSSGNTDINLFGGMWGGGAGGAIGSYGKTPEGKLVVASFADSYNQLVKAVRNYKAQEVKGGLGTGGHLGVQGGKTPPK